MLHTFLEAQDNDFVTRLQLSTTLSGLRDVYPLSFYPYWTENTAFCVVDVVLTLFLAVLATARKFDPSPRKVARDHDVTT